MSWPRILPSGLSNEINEDGIRYYKELIAELHSNGIEPLVTMYHWDLPQVLQDLGGWTNPITADYFVDYARVLLDHFGDSVRFWITFNEPLTFCHDGYGGNDAPGGRSSGFEDYMCAHTVLRAHGKTYRMFEKEFKRKQKSFMGITLDLAWIEPATTTKEDQIAAETTRQFFFGWFAHPIFSSQGDYPPVMRARVDANSRRQNFARSRLPHFTSEEVNTIQGASDFLGLNHYTTYLATMRQTKLGAVPSFDDDMGSVLTQKKEWPKTNSTWLRVVPWGLRKVLNWVKNTYNNPPVLITENGISSEPGLTDIERINYIDGYLRAVHAAITRDKCSVFAYTYWSLIDNFEWMRGYSERFGLYEVDYTSPQRERRARKSAAYFSEVTSSRCLPNFLVGDYLPFYFYYAPLFD
ncbi:myrosinase 1-like [Ostrinia furnacalis]|uniref:myrosinase 1-like n=1 Tax=Ostrinia furnacalis TaxID=93504 RepID=UPI001039E084|nr:myrosinase 1-like [Ostrinia furnacalis]